MPCQKPFLKDGIPVPCGKCESCAKRRASGWSFRILKEAEQLGSAFFVTLTYDNDHNPMQYENPDGTFTKTQQPTVDKCHLQRFIKRVRKQNSAKTIKYYAVSEYGTQSKRPHYHIIFLGLDIISFLGPEYWQLFIEGKCQLDGKNPIKLPTWRKGHVTIGKCTPASVAYTLKYISKGRQIPQYQGDKRQPEKSFMSKGIGKGYLTPEMVKIHTNDPERQYAVTHDSRKIALPRYLKDRLYDSLERQEMAKIYSQRYMEKLDLMGEKELQLYYKLKRNPVVDTRGTKLEKTGQI